MATESGNPLISFHLPLTGRLISWAEYGSPAGRPVIFLHGTPSSRLECQEFHGQLHEHNIRLIAPDRPGFGRSEMDHDRTVGSYAGDIKALAKHLGLQKYVVMGGSGGGPYALACARHFEPSDGLEAVAVVAGLPPWGVSLEGVNWNSKLSLYMAKWTPGLLRWLSHYSLPYPKTPPTGPLDQLVPDADSKADAERKIEALVKQLKPRDQEVMSKVETRTAFVASIMESCIQGISGYAHESNLFVNDWDFQLEDITFSSSHGRPLVLWYGTEDENATKHMGRWIAERVPGAVLHEEEGETHFTLGAKFVDYCKELARLGKL